MANPGEKGNAHGFAAEFARNRADEREASQFIFPARGREEVATEDDDYAALPALVAEIQAALSAEACWRLPSLPTEPGKRKPAAPAKGPPSMQIRMVMEGAGVSEEEAAGALAMPRERSSCCSAPADRGLRGALARCGEAPGAAAPAVTRARRVWNLAALM
jgi:hypothetical protein